ncbi:hypothetical protein [Priestia megaterium]|uniref:hypothetical protein n=1 Tax=Priestia megaterium TaxID=1404 RepID=UPI002858CEAD|nr:hypothetical protein [Priestia megaterium]MDR7207589.1 ribonucleoside-triphosphate reductase [Priestia megaterium]
MEEVTQATPEAVEPEVKEPEAKADPMIPKSRFDEINSKYKEMLAKIEAFESADLKRQEEEAARELERKKEQGKFEELYQSSQKELEAFKKYESRTQELESVINGMVETKLKSIPEDMVDLIPANLSAEQTLAWLDKAESKGLFGKPEPKEVGKPSNKSNEAPKIDNANLSPLDKILAGLGR